MILVTRLNGKQIRLNAEFIESVEAVPDTMITLLRGKTLMVKESVKLIVRRILRYQRVIHSTGFFSKKPRPTPQMPLPKPEDKT